MVDAVVGGIQPGCGGGTGFPYGLGPCCEGGMPGFAGLQAAVEGDCSGVVVRACLLTLNVDHLFRKKLLKIPLDIGVLLAGAFI
jgi:hypothetical protein